MTRETKIGLLVGLAFIIVIGILLEDHFASVSEPKPAPLAVVSKNLRDGIGNPIGDGAANNTSAQATEPRNVVPLAAERAPATVHEIRSGDSRSESRASAARPDGGASDVRIGPGPSASDSGASTTVTPTAHASGDHAAPDHVATDHTAAGRTPVDPRLDAIARQLGQPLVGVGVRTQGAAAPAASQEYKAEAGDSLSRIARKFLGADTKANRDAIVKANPSLQEDPNLIIVGKSYVIPAASASTFAPAPVAPSPAPTEARTTTPPAAATTENWYTTKPGDSLWRIATEQCGNGGAVAAIKQLNADKFPNGTDVVQANVRLRLPSKPVASVN